MSIQDLRGRLADIPGAADMTMQHAGGTQVLSIGGKDNGGRQVYTIAGRVVILDEGATVEQAEQAIRAALANDPMKQIPAAPTAEPQGGGGAVQATSPATDTAESEAGTAGEAALMASPANPSPSAALIPTVNAVAPAPRQSNPQGKPAMASGFAAQLQSMIANARAGVERAQADGVRKVGEAVRKLDDARDATAQVADRMVDQIEGAADAAMAELRQISNEI